MGALDERARLALERSDWATAAKLPLMPAADAYPWAKYPQAEASNAYARALGQLGRLAALQLPHAWARVERTLVAHGARLGDIKPTALRTEAFWLDALTQEQR